MNKPREIHFKTYLKPEPGIVYNMAKCSHDLWRLEREWAFVEKSAYEAAIKERDEWRTKTLDCADHPVVILLKKELTAAREEIAALNKLCEALAPEKVMKGIQNMGLEISLIRQENQRLRSALEKIASADFSGCARSDAKKAIAREALKEGGGE